MQLFYSSEGDQEEKIKTPKGEKYKLQTSTFKGSIIKIFFSAHVLFYFLLLCFKILIFPFYVNKLFVCMHVFIIKCVLDSCGGQKKALELELQAIVIYLVGTGNCSESS